MAVEKWNEIDEVWNLLDQIWNEFALFVALFGGKTRREKLNIFGGLDKKKKKRVVKLICMVKGQKFEEKKEVEDFKVSVDDIDLVLERAKKLRPKLYMEITGE
tara:strand:+ start:165 stop:473 length:309 start_codon:yes stop_codon:yes gene_type:complete